MSEDKTTKLSRQIDSGDVASRTMQALEEAFQHLDDECYRTFSTSDIHDDEGRMVCRLYLRVMDDVRNRFMLAIRNGETARKELLRLNEPKVRDIK